MNKFIKFVLTTTLMFGAGVAGYLIAKKKYEVLADKEIEDVKAKLSEYYKAQAPVVEGSKPTENKTKCEEKKNVTQTSSIAKNQTTEKEYFNYAKKYMTEDVEKKVEARDEASKKETHGNDPYIIDADSYMNSNYIARTLYYYTQEHILTDSDGRHIDNPEELIGKGAVDELEKQADDTVYVRNEKLEADFEIIIYLESIYSRNPKERVIPEEYE